MKFHVVFHANKKEKNIQESNKNIFPNRDIMLFSYDINLNAISLTICIQFNVLTMQCLKITTYFSYLLKSICNILKLVLCLCSNILMYYEIKKKSLEIQIIVNI